MKIRKSIFSHTFLSNKNKNNKRKQQKMNIESLSNENLEDDATLASTLHKQLLDISNLYMKSFHTNLKIDKKLETNHVNEPSAIDNAHQFLQFTKEKSLLNQYWYSHNTIQTLTSAIIQISNAIHSNNDSHKIRIAFLSTPSLYFAIPSQFKFEHSCILFEVSLHLSKTSLMPLKQRSNLESIIPIRYNLTHFSHSIL